MTLPAALRFWSLWGLLAGPPPDGRAILAAMHERYAGKWYGTLTFVQHNTATRLDDSTEHSTWREYAALPGRLRTRQFWVDKERLLFVRLLEPGQRDTTHTSDIRFNDYRPVGPAWVSAEVAFLVDGRQRWLEQYAEIHTGTPLPDALFDPRRWSAQRP